MVVHKLIPDSPWDNRHTIYQLFPEIPPYCSKSQSYFSNLVSDSVVSDSVVLAAIETATFLHVDSVPGNLDVDVPEGDAIHMKVRFSEEDSKNGQNNNGS